MCVCDDENLMRTNTGHVFKVREGNHADGGSSVLKEPRPHTKKVVSKFCSGNTCANLAKSLARLLFNRLCGREGYQPPDNFNLVDYLLSAWASDIHGRFRRRYSFLIVT